MIKKTIKEKLLLLLYGGVAFGYSITPHRQWEVVCEIAKEWNNIDKRKLYATIRNLYKSKLVDKKENPDGSYTLFLTDKGKIKALTYHFQDIKINGGNWDGKWRMVVFDIPDGLRKKRDALREKLNAIGFYKLQESVFVFPYKCEDELDFLIEFFNLRKFVRCAIIESIDNNLHLKSIFNLN